MSLKLKLAKTRVHTAALAGMKAAAEHVLGESQKQVPLEEGTLLRSGKTEVDDRQYGVEGIISYDTPYAVVQHENLDFRHDPGRKAKYLEDPLHDNRKEVVAIIAAAIRKAI